VHRDPGYAEAAGLAAAAVVRKGGLSSSS
jgi:hypothetical protein